jgi:hypothetical protein
MRNPNHKRLRREPLPSVRRLRAGAGRGTPLRESPSNNEMKLTKAALARVTRLSQLISVFYGPRKDRR